MTTQAPKGRGWHGDAAGHARAGRIGGSISRPKRNKVTNHSPKPGKTNS